MINFDGNDIMEDGEGIITDFKRGFLQRKKSFEEQARADGELAKYYNKPGCSHSVSFQFLNRSEDQMVEIESRIALLGDYIRVGTLVIESQGFSANNCVVDEISYDGKEFGIANVDPASLTYDVAVHSTFTISFRQLK